MQKLQKALGYTFHNEAHLRLALTHPSTKLPDNQRLEFLGDAVLEFCVSDMLYHKDPHLHEGELTARRAALVCERTLSAIARSLDLGRCLIMGHGEDQTGGRDKASILADAVEAVLAAVYLDGGLDEAHKLVRQYVLSAENQENRTSSKDSKTAFQELIHADHKGRAIRYELVSEAGPDHKKVFTMRVLVDDEEWGVGSGPSKQAAGQAAAQMAMEKYRHTCD